MSAGDAFERIAQTLTSPVVIVTVAARGERDGCLVGFSTQCSIDPVRYLVCLSTKNRTWELARDADAVVVHMLHDSSADRALARRFGEETGFETDKFDGCDWKAGSDGTPILNGCDWFMGRIVDRTNFGDHVGLVLEVGTGHATRTSERYLDFLAVRDFDAGNPP
jgi:flavin reductase (DIM6/NTAB) family NADH-FMN oxidoreductase RutF